MVFSRTEMANTIFKRDFVKRQEESKTNKHDVSFLNEYKYQASRKNDPVTEFLEGKISLLTPSSKKDFKLMLVK